VEQTRSSASKSRAKSCGGTRGERKKKKKKMPGERLGRRGRRKKSGRCGGKEAPLTILCLKKKEKGEGRAPSRKKQKRGRERRPQEVWEAVLWKRDPEKITSKGGGGGGKGGDESHQVNPRTEPSYLRKPCLSDGKRDLLLEKGSSRSAF